MATIVTRAGKGSPLTNAEVDANFVNLNNDKLEVATAASTYAPLTGTGASGTWNISITGNAATVTNGVVTTGSYANPTWITSLAGSKVSGNITGNAANVTGIVAIANGGTGATDAATARTNLGLAIGTNVQAYDAELAAIAALAPTLDNFIVGNGTTWILETPAQARGSLGGTTVGQNFFTLANPTAVTFPRINADNTVSALDAATFRTAIGAGTSSTTGTVTSIVAGTGLSGGTITTSGTIALANTTVTPGSYTNASITVDAQGRLTAASSGSGGGVTSITGTANQITASASTGAVTLSLPPVVQLAGVTGAYTGQLYLGSRHIRNVTATNAWEMVNAANTAVIYTFDNAGNLTAAGDVTSNSDERLKENIEVIPNALAKVESVRGVTFTRKADKSAGMGVVAQEIRKVAPEVVMIGADGMMSVSYGNLVGLLIEAVKDLSGQVKELKQKVGV